MDRRRTLVAAAAAALLSIAWTGQAGASDLPSGQVMIGHTSFDSSTGTFTGGGGTVEPAYDDSTGTLVYLLTPNHAPAHPNSNNVAPIYIPIYPTGSTVGTLNCMHQPGDNCPDHGPLLAGLAKTLSTAVYGRGVLGHDHLVGIASTGGDFNVLWEPIAVIFTDKALTDGAINTHLTTLDAIRAAETNGDAFEIPLPQATFHCSAVSATVYDNGTPAPTLPPLP